jgi:hypothetical protein
MSTSDTFDAFIELSVALTAFDRVTLFGTGQAQDYFDAVSSIVGEQRMDAIAAIWRSIIADTIDPAEIRVALRRDLLGDMELGPITRNILKLWYTGTWYQLPSAWRDQFGASHEDVTFVISAASYPEGLLWKAIGANPHGAKAPGYGTWANPPTIPEFNRASTI